VKKSKAIIVLLLVLSLVVVFISDIGIVKAEPKTIVVPDDYVSIQEAIDNALEGDTIYVKSGMYHENLGVNKSLSLIGEDIDTTIIDGNPPEGYRVPITIHDCDNVSVSGFKLLYGYAGVQIWSVKNCNISGNRIAGGQHGIKMSSSENNNITGNIFESIGGSSAIQLSSSTNNLVNRNYIDSCVEGIQIWQGSDNNIVSENTIKNCKNYAIMFKYSNSNTITRNNITDSGYGTSIYVSNMNTISNNNYVNNSEQFIANEWYALTFGYNVSVNTINENYWNDYNGNDANGDGIGDSPYVIDENNQDNNPLIEPSVIPEFPSWTPLLIILIVVMVVTVVYRRSLHKHDRGRRNQ